MKRVLTVVGVLAVGFVLWRVMSTPDTAGPADTPESAGGQTIIGRGLAAGAAARTDASKQYFQRQLIESGADSGQPFGKNLAELGVDGRQLQAMPLDQAYTLAHDAAMKVEDVTTRGRYLLELFNETER